MVALVPERQRAWHAGVSWWQGRGALNDVSLGIELVNPGHEWGYRPFPEPQMAALVELSRAARAAVGDRPGPGGRPQRHRTRPQGGSGRAVRVGAAGGGGPVPGRTPPAVAAPPDPVLAAAALAAFGYPGTAQGVPAAALWRAFQRRWRPARCDGVLDGVSMGLALAVAALQAGDRGIR